MNLVGLGAALAMGMVGLGISLAQGSALGKGLEGISKQPEAGGKIQTAMIVGMAIMETIGVLTFVIAIILTGKM